MKKLFIALFVASCLLAASMPACAGTVKNWELVYENNADGTAKSGALGDLVSAIRTGADVQIVAHGPDSDVLVKPQRVRIDSNGALVVALLSDNYYTPTMTDVVQRIMIFQTDGTRNIIFQQDSGYTNDFSTRAISWYVNR